MSNWKKFFLAIVGIVILVVGGLTVNYFRPTKRMARHYSRALIYLQKQNYPNAIQELEKVLKIDPKKEEVRLLLAESYRKDNEKEKALENLKMILQESRRNHKAFQMQVQIYLENNEIVEALQACNRHLQFLLTALRLQSDNNSLFAANQGTEGFFKKNKYSENIAYNDPYLKLPAENAIVLNQRGLVLWRLGRIIDAIRDFRRAISIAPNQANAYLHLAKLYWSEERKREALELLEQYLKDFPNSKEVRMQMGKFFLADKKYPAAFDEFFQVYQEHPQALLEVSPFLATTAIAVGRTNQAIALAKEVFARYEQEKIDAMLFYVRGLEFFQQGDHTEAIEDFEKAKRAFLGVADLYYKLALSYVAKNQNILAIAELRDVIKLSPELIQARVLLINLLLEERQWASAEQQCQAALTLLPEQENTELRIEILRMQARALAEEGKSQQARKVFQKIASLDRNSIGGQIGQALVDMKEKLYGKALIKLQKLRLAEQKKLKKINQDREQSWRRKPDPYLPCLMARCYLMMQDYKNALKYVQQSLELAPKSIQASLLLADIRVAQNKPSLAAEEYEKLLEAFPNNRRICFTLASFYLTIPEPDKALATLEKGKMLSSTEPSVLLLRARISLEKENYQHAIELLEEIPVKNAKIYEIIGNIYRKLGNQEEALRYLQLAQGVAGSTTLQVTLAISHYLLWNWNEAARSLNDHLDKFTNDSLVRLFLSTVYISMNQPDEATGEVQKVLKGKPTEQFQALAHLIKSAALIENQEFDQAKAEIKKIPELAEVFEKDFFQLLDYCKKKETNFTTLLGMLILNTLGDPHSALFQSKGAPEALQENLYFLYSKASILRRLGKIEQEREILEKLAASPQAAVFVNSRLGQILMQRRELIEARDFLVKSLKQAPKSPELWSNLGQCYQGLRDTFRARQCYQKVLEVTKEYPKNRYRLQALLQLARISLIPPGDLNYALECAKEAYQHIPNQPYLVDLLGIIHSKQKNFAQASKFFSDAHRLSPQDPGILFRLGAMYAKQKKWQLATHSLEKAFSLTDSFAENRQAKQLLENLKIVQNKPKSLQEMKTMAQAYLEMGHSKTAEKILQIVIKKSPKDPEAYFSLAKLYWDTKRHQEMERALLKGLSIEPRSPSALVSLAGYYESQNQVDKAIVYYEKVLELTQGEETDNNKMLAIQSYNNLAYLYLLPVKYQPQKALEYAKKAVERLPENPAILDTLGWALYHLEKYAQAQKHLEKAIQITPNFPGILYHLAEVYLKQNNKSGALRTVKRALEISQEFSEADKARKLLEKLER